MYQHSRDEKSFELKLFQNYSCNLRHIREELRNKIFGYQKLSLQKKISAFSLKKFWRTNARKSSFTNDRTAQEKPLRQEYCFS